MRLDPLSPFTGLHLPGELKTQLLSDPTMPSPFSFGVFTLKHHLAGTIEKAYVAPIMFKKDKYTGRLSPCDTADAGDMLGLLSRAFSGSLTRSDHQVLLVVDLRDVVGAVCGGYEGLRGREQSEQDINQLFDLDRALSLVECISAVMKEGLDGGHEGPVHVGIEILVETSEVSAL